MKPRTGIIGAILLGGLALTYALAADPPLPQQAVEKAAAPKAKRLTPEERRQLLHRLTQPSPELQRRLTNSAPRKVVVGTNRVAQRINAALKQ